MSGWASSSRSANSNADRFIAAGLAPAATHAAFVPPSASVTKGSFVSRRGHDPKSGAAYHSRNCSLQAPVSSAPYGEPPRFATLAAGRAPAATHASFWPPGVSPPPRATFRSGGFPLRCHEAEPCGPASREEGRGPFFLDLLELVARGDREGHHHRLDHGNRLRKLDSDPVDGQDRGLRPLLARPTRGRPTRDDRVEEVPEFQLQNLIEVGHL